MALTQRIRRNQQAMDDLQKGISNVPAILLTTPQVSLQSLNLAYYEVFPTEPLHDLKGHMQHIINEATKNAEGETLDILKRIQDTALNKGTLRCSDYRKALILIYSSLQQCTSPDIQMLDLFRTATEITEIYVCTRLQAYTKRNSKISQPNIPAWQTVH